MKFLGKETLYFLFVGTDIVISALSNEEAISYAPVPAFLNASSLLAIPSPSPSSSSRLASRFAIAFFVSLISPSRLLSVSSLAWISASRGSSFPVCLSAFFPATLSVAEIYHQ
jgi:hypothetical protein